ncbi:uncharacterized protein B0I36DRAFT_68812 [Microdochium trichocladiopsis]|uniref:Uncharacterized protein n=1 Tax=Microdochium trichocladiopsis TaxID=1682393 RepID=A0A9P8YDU2_9PEZI|nr:uncharacterized protein B0I36DRAFT_68812 [Microdochium trichocladiopsis]KAH7037625.1 hypothetical protein B0I36DRAFT_68812 [Microdochium trichocladiopsis]
MNVVGCPRNQTDCRLSAEPCLHTGRGLAVASGQTTSFIRSSSHRCSGWCTALGAEVFGLGSSSLLFINGNEVLAMDLSFTQDRRRIEALQGRRTIGLHRAGLYQHRRGRAQHCPYEAEQGLFSGGQCATWKGCINLSRADDGQVTSARLDGPHLHAG